jgi:serine/threonine protein kinase
MEELINMRLGKYTLMHHLAHGGMSEVYLARSESDDRPYALKVVERDDTDCYWRFQREVQMLNKAQHAHILPILDYGEDGKFSYYVMPYIEHGTLKQHLANGPLSEQEAEAILTQIGEALQFLHESGFVHRDIKPANILLNETGQSWLADFGLAKEVEADLDLTNTGCIIGTPPYMAPELMERPANAYSDVYALGIVLYEMLTGQRPFSGTTPLEICWKHTTAPPPPPSTLNPLISPAVEQVILHALEKDPRARFATPLELVAAYHQARVSPSAFTHSTLNWITEVAEAAAIKTAPEVVYYERLHKRPLAAAMVALFLLLLLGAGSLAIEFQSHPSAVASNGAQVIMTHGHTATSVPSPTQAASQPGATPTVAAPVRTSNPPAPPDNHNKQKHHGGGDD